MKKRESLYMVTRPATFYVAKDKKPCERLSINMRPSPSLLFENSEFRHERYKYRNFLWYFQIF